MMTVGIAKQILAMRKLWTFVSGLSTIMSLLNPAILFGLGLAVIPVVLHFLLRARPKITRSTCGKR